MIAHQRLVATDGYEVMLFPLPYLYMSQDEGGNYSHAGTLCMDFLGWGANGRITRCPYYAPCTARLISSTGDPSTNMMIWQSVDKVHLPNGSLDYVCWQFGHDNNPPYTTVGTIVQQGDVIGYTGTLGPGVTGDHVHYNVAQGTYAGGERVPPNNNWQFKNSIHIYDANYVNDTVIVQGYGHNWRTYGGPTPPPPVPPTPFGKGDFVVMFNNISRTKRKEVNLWRA